MLSQTRLRPGPEAKALDLWTRRSLGERFDDTLEEEMPSELVALVAKFGK